jgi:sporulation protein YunB
MRAKFERKNKFQLKLSSIFLVLGFIIAFLTMMFLNIFNKKITPNLLTIANDSINKLNESILMQYKVSNLYKSLDLNNIIIIDKNKNDEIISVDFNLDNVYEALSIIANYLHDSINDNKKISEILNYYDKELNINDNNIVLTIPMGSASNNIYFANLGPRIPVKIEYVNYLTANIRLKLENYGINTILVSIYIDCDISNKYIIPTISEEINNSYSILISSKLIEGVVPNYYGGSIDTKSSILNVQFE